MELQTVITPDTCRLLGVEPEHANEPWPGGSAYFENVPYANIRQLGDLLGEEFLEGTKGYSPTNADLLEQLEDHAEGTLFSGYIISNRRPDTRVTIEAVHTVRTDDNILFLRHADELGLTADRIYAWYD